MCTCNRNQTSRPRGSSATSLLAHPAVASFDARCPAQSLTLANRPCMLLAEFTPPVLSERPGGRGCSLGAGRAPARRW